MLEKKWGLNVFSHVLIVSLLIIYFHGYIFSPLRCAPILGLVLSLLKACDRVRLVWVFLGA